MVPTPPPAAPGILTRIPDQAPLAEAAIAAGQPVIKVGVYARISDDPDDRKIGVTDQLKDGTTLAALRRWIVWDHYVDNDLSAAKRGVVREDFERMLEDLREGVIQGIICVDLDRLVRKNSDLERIVTIYDASGGGLVFATIQGSVDLSTDDGITMAHVLVAFAGKEIRNIVRRLKRRHLQRAQAGLVVGGRRPFGYSASPEARAALVQARENALNYLQVIGDPVLGEGEEAIDKRLKQDIAVATALQRVHHEERRRKDPDLAVLIKDAAEEILEGAGIYQIVTTWNEARIYTPLGNPWSHQTLKTMLMNPRLAGWRSYNPTLPGGKRTTGGIALDDDGQRVRGEQDQILHPDIWELLVKELETRAKLRSRPAKQRYLLSGLVRCGICGVKMHAKRIAKKFGDGHIYRCPGRNSNPSGCGKVSITGRIADSHMEKLLLALRARESSPDHQVQPWPREGELRPIEARIEELMAAFTAKILNAEVIFPSVKKLQDELLILRNEKADWMHREMILSARDSNFPEDWSDATITEQRMTLTQYFSAVMILPVGKENGQKTDPSRIDPVWLDSGERLHDDADPE